MMVEEFNNEYKDKDRWDVKTGLSLSAPIETYRPKKN